MCRFLIRMDVAMYLQQVIGAAPHILMKLRYYKRSAVISLPVVMRLAENERSEV